MPNKLNGKRIAILATDGVEQVEMTEPRKALDAAGAKTELVSPAKGQLQAWRHMDKGDKFPVDVELDAADPKNYDALVLPGGVANPDQLRRMPKAVEFVKSFFERRQAGGRDLPCSLDVGGSRCGARKHCDLLAVRCRPI